MSAGTYLMISFQSDETDYSGLAQIAAHCAKQLRERMAKEGWDPNRDSDLAHALRFLQDVVDKKLTFSTSTYPGPPMVWAVCAKNADETGREFVEALVPFFRIILKADVDTFPGVPYGTGKVLVFAEYEQMEKLYVHEIRLGESGDLVSLIHEPDFCWAH